MMDLSKGAGRSNIEAGDQEDHYIKMMDPEDFTLREGLRMIFNNSVWQVFGFLFHPCYMLVNAKILGQMEDQVCAVGSDGIEVCEAIGPKVHLAAFGLGSSTIGLLLLANGDCFSDGLTNLIPQAYGAQQYQLCGAYLNRMLILLTCIFVPFLIPLQFVEHLFLFMGLGKQVASLASMYVRVVSPGVFGQFYCTAMNCFA